MSTPAGILSDLATVLLVLRDRPSAKDEIKQAFHRLVGGLANRDHMLKVSEEDLSWDRVEVPVGRGELAALHEHLKAHGVGEIHFPMGVMTSALLSLFRVLAAPAGTYGSFDHLVARVDAMGVGMISLFPFEERPPEAASAGVPVPAPPDTAGHPPEVDPMFPPPPPPSPLPPAPERRPKGPEEEDALSSLGPDVLSEAQVGMMHFVMPAEQSAPMEELVDRLTDEEDESRALEVLNQLMGAGELAAREADWNELLKTAYALRRILPRSSLERIARMTAHGQYKTEAAAVLRRMGADGTEVLLKHLTDAEDMTERRAYFNALKDMTEGTDLLVHMLSHDQWFVVRNVADLCGELRLERAVGGLSKLMTHDDERVRRAAAGALAKIGGPTAGDPLRRALKDPSPAVRLQAAQDLDGRKARGLTMTLAVAAEEEEKPDVQREMYLALGRIGSPDAIQALLKAAEPAKKGLFRRKAHGTVRLAAVAGLHAAGPSAANALKTLMEDDDAEVREAVQKSLATLWE
jgi:HEAT repeats/PBS lyase HEAT-like repeat